MFAPVRSLTAFEETVDRLGTAIRLGLLPPGTRLPAERELCAMLGIARSTLRQALTALAESGHLRAVRGRGGGTFVTDPLPRQNRHRSRCSAPGARPAISGWPSRWALRRSRPNAPARGARRPRGAGGKLDELVDDFASYRQADVRLHVGLAESTGSGRLVTAMTEVQGEMTGLIALIPHPREVLLSSNLQHRRILAAVRRCDRAAAATEMVEHVRGTEYVLAGFSQELESAAA